MASFSEYMKSLMPKFDEMERRQDSVLMLTRETIRLCARAIREVHTGEKDALLISLGELEAKVNELKTVDHGFEHISLQCYQEYAEIKCFLSISEQQDLPTHDELGISPQAYLAGVADCVGEMKRALQISLKNGDYAKAEYYFTRMNDIYDNLMLLKYSSSLIGPLKQKQDMVRSSVEHARSEMLLSKFALKG